MTAVQTFPRKAKVSRAAVPGAFLVGAIFLLAFFAPQSWSRAGFLISGNDLLSLLNFVPDSPPYREYVALGHVDAFSLFYELPFASREIGPDEWTRRVENFYGTDVIGLEWFVDVGNRATVLGYSDRSTVENAIIAVERYASAPALEIGGSHYQGGFSLNNFPPWMLYEPEHIVLFDEYLIAGPEALVIDTYDAHEGDIPSLAADSAFWAAVTAVAQNPEVAEDDDSILIVLGDYSGHSRILGFTWDADAPVDFTVGAFALRCVDESPQVTWAMVFPEETDVEVASTALTEQVQQFFDSGVIGRWTFTTTEIDIENLPVAMVTARSRSWDCESR